MNDFLTKQKFEATMVDYSDIFDRVNEPEASVIQTFYVNKDNSSYMLWFEDSGFEPGCYFAHGQSEAHAAGMEEVTAQFGHRIIRPGKFTQEDEFEAYLDGVKEFYSSKLSGQKK